MYRGIVLWAPSHTLSSVKNTVQILPFRAMNLLGKENESWLLLFTLPQHLSRLFIRFKHLSPTSLFSSDTNISRVHSSACTQTSVGAASSPIPLGPKAPHWVLPAQFYWGLGACKCFFTGAASLLRPSPPHRDLAEEGFYHSTQSLYSHRVFFCMTCWLLQL